MAKNPSAWENAVTAPEPLPVGNRDRAVLAGHKDTRTNSSRPSSEAIRTGTRAVTVRAALRRKPRPRADHRSDEGMEREDGGGRKARQHDERLVTDHREAKRLARFQRHAMDEDAGLAELRHNAMRQIACALRCAARQHDHVAGIRARCAWQSLAQPLHQETRRTGRAHRPLQQSRQRESRRCCRRRRPA